MPRSGNVRSVNPPIGECPDRLAPRRDAGWKAAFVQRAHDAFGLPITKLSGGRLAQTKKVPLVYGASPPSRQRQSPPLSVLALEQRLAVLVQLQLDDLDVGRVDGDLHRRAVRLVAGDLVHVDRPAARLQQRSESTGPSHNRIAAGGDDGPSPSVPLLPQLLPPALRPPMMDTVVVVGVALGTIRSSTTMYQ
eukprot:gene6382-biopygen8907